MIHVLLTPVMEYASSHILPILTTFGSLTTILAMGRFVILSLGLQLEDLSTSVLLPASMHPSCRGLLMVLTVVRSLCHCYYHSVSVRNQDYHHSCPCLLEREELLRYPQLGLVHISLTLMSFILSFKDQPVLAQ